MIDFTKYPTLKKSYAGANGSKISVLYHGEIWMVKFPSIAKLNDKIHYANSCVSEYLGCHVFNILGVPAQETLLGTYYSGKKEKLVVACKDFTADGRVLQDFASLKNQMIDSERSGYGTELSDVVSTLDEQSLFDRKTLKRHFWDMFIIDALIGNWDRHNGNWGFLYDYRTDSLEIAPVFDCGSSLFPQADPKLMEKIISDRNETNDRVYNRPLSALQIQGRKINYFDFIFSLENNDCNDALKRITPKIDLSRINEMIEEIPSISDIQIRFYEHILQQRKEKILDQAYKKLVES
jgi:hypothetical protein